MKEKQGIHSGLKKNAMDLLMFFLTAKNLKLFGQKLQHFSNDAFQSYHDLFQVN